MAEYRQYSNAFNELWQALSTPEPPPSPIRIDWDYQNFLPEKRYQPVDATPWLTPIHWAVCAKQRWRGVSVNVKVAAAPPSRNSLLVNIVCSLPAVTRPWLRFVTCDEARRLQNEDGAAGDAAPSASPGALFEQLFKLLTAEFTSEANRVDLHGMHNLLLPLILIGSPARPQGHAPDQRYALAVLLKAVGLMRSVPRTEPNDALQSAGPQAKLYLVDDQAEHGWLDWVRSVVTPNDTVTQIGVNDFHNGLMGGVRALPALLDPKAILLLNRSA